jgi:hypothetical protein
MVEGLPGRVKKIAANSETVCALLENRELYCWGGYYGGGGGAPATHIPTLVFPDVADVQTSHPYAWYVRLSGEGRWYSWADNTLATSRLFSDPWLKERCCESYIPEP